MSEPASDDIWSPEGPYASGWAVQTTGSGKNLAEEMEMVLTEFASQPYLCRTMPDLREQYERLLDFLHSTYLWRARDLTGRNKARAALADILSRCDAEDSDAAEA